MLVREVYFPAPPVMRAGAVVGSRTMRQRFRRRRRAPECDRHPGRSSWCRRRVPVRTGEGRPRGPQADDGLAATREARGAGGKTGCGRARAGDGRQLGWGTFDQAERTQTRPKAACVYLWARDPALCAGPAAAGPGFSASVDEGQIALPAGERCSVDGLAIASRTSRRSARVTGDTQVALSALFARTMESAGHPVSSDPRGRTRAEHRRRSVPRPPVGSTASALRARHASVTLARAVIADQLRRRAIARGLRIEAPTSAQVALYYSLYSMLPVRQVRADRSPTWLGGRGRASRSCRRARASCSHCRAT